MLLQTDSHIVYDREEADPCPFCGKDDLYLDDLGHETRKWCVICRAFGARGPETKENRKEAVYLWNDRKQIQPTLKIPRRVEA